MTPFTSDLDLLEQTVAVAKAAFDRGDGAFGAAVVLDGNVVSLEAVAIDSTLDPTAHGEVCAIRAACRNLGTTDLTGGVLYTSCEPCVMCASAAVWAGIRSVIYAAPIEAVTRYPVRDLFPSGTIDWSLLPLKRTFMPLDDAIELLSR
ncbi:nucleoside deaminase [Amycolatopsis sp. GM8]|uniref:nucleoside deaminase n=1 Tax=Amycolatopsis sp. GM8 TaxID=2896530 RepID=UPI001F2C81DE|nr:nucleoside deaminase [Amycolatopsis sp. GM8]